MDKLEKYQIFASCTAIGLSILLSAFLISTKIQKDESITVTGSASKEVKSDKGMISVDIEAKAKTQKDAFNDIKRQYPIVIKYFQDKGLTDIETKAINGYYTYVTANNGSSTGEIDKYNATQTIKVTSDDVQKIKAISTDISNLTNEGVNLNIYQPEYYYSDLAAIKVELLKEAALDAKTRAKSMLSAANSSVGKVKSMKMGVFQITSPDSTDVSDYGINDTSSIDKKVTAVTNVVFQVK